METRLLLTMHAKIKMAELGINKEQIKMAIRQGATMRQTDGYLASFAGLKVAYKKIGEDLYKIKTVFYG